jgi:hypothetical protein
MFEQVFERAGGEERPVRRYDEVIDVRRGLVSGQEAPAQFLWRDRLWVVRDIIAHWVETGAWWEQSGVGVLFGEVGGAEASRPAAASGGAEASRPAAASGGAEASRPAAASGPDRGADLLGEKEVWRVEAMRPRTGAGVFDVSFDWALGQWRLVCCVD